MRIQTVVRLSYPELVSTSRPVSICSQRCKWARSWAPSTRSVVVDISWESTYIQLRCGLWRRYKISLWFHIPFHWFIQEAITSLELCLKPIIVGVHSACIGAGVDLITAADIRYCTDDAWFQVKEVDIGMAADVGTLQRLPKVIGNQSLVRELCFTGRKFDSKEATTAGLVSQVNNKS